MKILVIKFRHIGDVLLSTPLLHNLRLLYPDAQIDVAVNEDALPILMYNPHIDHVFPYPRKRGESLYSKIKKEVTYIKSLLSTHYDLTINLTEGERGAYISILNRAHMKMGFQPKKGILKYLNIYTKIAEPILAFHHTVNKDLQFINLLGKEIQNKRVSIFWPKEDEALVEKLLNQQSVNQFVHIHPVSRWMFKSWEDYRMAEVIDYLQDKGLKVVITAAPDPKEISHVTSILNLCKEKPLDLSGKLSLTQLACLSSKASLFFGVDTAPMHIAAAVDTPVLALFGASDPRIWGPWDNNLTGSSLYEWKDGIQKSGIHTAIVKTNQAFYYDEQGVKKSIGMESITTEEVKKAIDELI
jgi:heptosyltransferase-3